MSRISKPVLGSYLVLMLGALVLGARNGHTVEALVLMAIAIVVPVAIARRRQRSKASLCVNRREHTFAGGHARGHLVTRSATDTTSPVEPLLAATAADLEQSVDFVLELLRTSLRLRTAALLCFEAGGKLQMRATSSALQAVPVGPFEPAKGIMAAAIASNELVCLNGQRAQRNALLAAPVSARAQTPTGMIAALPLSDHGADHQADQGTGHGGLCGLLVVDREATDELNAEERASFHAIAPLVVLSLRNERRFLELERTQTEQAKLYRAVNLLSQAKSESEVIQAFVDSAHQMTKFQGAAVTLFDSASQTHLIRATSGVGLDHLRGRSFPHNRGLVSMVVDHHQALPFRGRYDHLRQVVFTRELAPRNCASLLVLPLESHDTMLGTLILSAEEPDAFSESAQPLLEVLARHVAVSLDNARLVQQLAEQATTDGLTGLLNQRALTELGRRKLESARRFAQPLSILICDLDHFKQVNDQYGHAVGDVVLKGFAAALQRVKRQTDDVGRVGGEEFVVICEQTDIRGAQLLADRLRRDLAATNFYGGKASFQVSCSIGVAQYLPAKHRDTQSDWQTLFKATDDALYSAKRSGRDRVVAATPGLRGAA